MANPNQGDDQDDFSGVRNKDGSIKKAGLARTAKLSPFGLAFDEARKAGKKDFTFKGKKYTTEMAKPKAKAAAPTKTSDDYKKDAGDFKKVAEDTTAKRNKIADMANRMMGQDKFKAATTPDTEPESLYGTYKKGGSVSASRRGDGCATKGKTRGRMV